MDFKDTFARFVRPALHPQEKVLYEALETARQAKFAENYDVALRELDRAHERALASHDHLAAAVADLHKSEIFMRQTRYAEAEQVNQHLLDDAENDTERSYTYTMVGMVAQAQGDWAGARTAYESALAAARKVGAEGAEGRALGRLADTYLHDENASYAIHLLRDALTKLSNAADVEPSSYFTGIMGQALIASGQESEGQHLLDRALRIAEQLGYRGYERHWGLVLGDRAMDEGRAQDAHAYYNLILRLFAPETVDPDYVIAVTQISKASLSLGHPDEALAYAQTALKTAQKLGNVSLERKAEGALGVALRASGRSDEAIPHLRTALQQDDIAQTDVLRSLAAAQADSGDSDGAVQTYQRAVQQAKEKSLELAQAQRDLGLTYQRRKDYQAAVNEWTSALAIYDAHHANSQVARLYCDIGSARKLLGQRARAMKDYEQALVILNSLNGGDQETRGLVLSNAANAYAEQGDVESADAFFTESIGIAERLGDHVAETTRNGNYGWFLLLVGRPRRAMATLERALVVSQEHNLTLQSAIQLDNLGLVYDSLGDLPAALERHRKALALVTDPVWTAQIKLSLANTLIAQSQLDEAQTLIDEALSQARTSAHGELIIAALTSQARLMVARQQLSEADAPLTEALALARKLDHRRLLAEALSVRSQQQTALEKTADAAASWDEAQKLYAMLHMPQAKTQPTWLAKSATQP